jgi:uncharacterized protein YrrD
VDDLGAPISYLVLERGADVYSAEGEKVGRVDEVRADADSDIFDALVVEHGLLPGGGHVVPADQVDEIYERGVVLRLDAAAVEALPAPD